MVPGGWAAGIGRSRKSITRRTTLKTHIIGHFRVMVVLRHDPWRCLILILPVALDAGAEGRPRWSVRDRVLRQSEGNGRRLQGFRFVRIGVSQKKVRFGSWYQYRNTGASQPGDFCPVASGWVTVHSPLFFLNSPNQSRVTGAARPPMSGSSDARSVLRLENGHFPRISHSHVVVRTPTRATAALASCGRRL
jgi:hypothetical protein